MTAMFYHFVDQIQPETSTGHQDDAIDLTRLPEEAIKALRQARQQLNAFLLRHGRRYTGGIAKWTARFARWRDGSRFDHSVQQVVFTDTASSGRTRFGKSAHWRALNARIRRLIPH